MKILNIGSRYRSITICARDVEKGVTRVSERGFGDYKEVKRRGSEQSINQGEDQDQGGVDSVWAWLNRGERKRGLTLANAAPRLRRRKTAAPR